MTRRRRPASIRRAVGRLAAGATAGAIAVAALFGAHVDALAQTAGRAPPNAGRPRLLARIDSGPVTVGDHVTLHLRTQLPAGARLADAVPVDREPLPDGIRLLHADSLRPDRGGAVTGVVTLVFFRPGPARVPPMSVTYRAMPDAPIDTVVSEALAMVVTPLVPVGSGTLRDIKDIDTAPISLGTAATTTAIAIAVLVIVVVASRVKHHRRAARLAAAHREAAVGAPVGPYGVALARLAAIAEDWAGRGDLDSHYVLTADVLRRYLNDAHGIPALERTTSELLVALPAPLSTPRTYTTARELFNAADLVKFARYSPRPSGPTVLLTTARSLLADWDAVGPASTVASRDPNADGRPTTDGGTRTRRDRDAIR